MRGDPQQQEGFIVLASAEEFVPDDLSLRAIRRMVDEALERMSATLQALYAKRGRPSIAPEVLLRAQLIQILYAIPSERR
jgi:transposase